MARRAQQAGAGRQSPPRDTWRSLKSADFSAVLGAPILAKSPHFVLHHLPADPVSHSRAGRAPVVKEISTTAAPFSDQSVDNIDAAVHWWLGLVVPKRHARRAATRSLLKRQMRAHAAQSRSRLPAGQWLIRLRAPFDARLYPSAASAQLRDAAGSELARVFAGALT
jgi:ribonuclease P protein component